jgi:hypothetical protein
MLLKASGQLEGGVSYIVHRTAAGNAKIKTDLLWTNVPIGWGDEKSGK